LRAPAFGGGPQVVLGPVIEPASSRREVRAVRAEPTVPAVGRVERRPLAFGEDGEAEAVQPGSPNARQARWRSSTICQSAGSPAPHTWRRPPSRSCSIHCRGTAGGTEEVDGVVGDVEVVASGAARLRAEAACSSEYEPLWYGM